MEKSFKPVVGAVVLIVLIGVLLFLFYQTSLNSSTGNSIGVTRPVSQIADAGESDSSPPRLAGNCSSRRSSIANEDSGACARCITEDPNNNRSLDCGECRGHLRVFCHPTCAPPDGSTTGGTDGGNLCFSNETQQECRDNIQSTVCDWCNGVTVPQNGGSAPNIPPYPSDRSLTCGPNSFSCANCAAP